MQDNQVPATTQKSRNNVRVRGARKSGQRRLGRSVIIRSTGTEEKEEKEELIVDHDTFVR